jgi:hypothetical protein
MNEAALQALIADQREMIDRLSARIDALDRAGLGKSVEDTRRDKLQQRHADAFGTHKRDGIAHTFPEYPFDYSIMGMDEVRDDAGADAGAFVMSFAGFPNTVGGTDPHSGTLDMVNAVNTDDTIIKATAATDLITVQPGTYAVAVAALVAFQYIPASTGSEATIGLVEKDGIGSPQLEWKGPSGCTLGAMSDSGFTALKKSLCFITAFTCTVAVNLKLNYTKDAYVVNLGAAGAFVIKLA